MDDRLSEHLETTEFCVQGADASAAAFGKTAFADFASARDKFEWIADAISSKYDWCRQAATISMITKEKVHSGISPRGAAKNAAQKGKNEKKRDSVSWSASGVMFSCIRDIPAGSGSRKSERPN